ncbi:insecticidal delta-endotoxin Cry8Ea1 family protein [Bacillus cereus]|nr:insecticidal delta-endotoxin Cry8Ea1 family protein [Bacillus cereus]
MDDVINNIPPYYNVLATPPIILEETDCTNPNAALSLVCVAKGLSDAWKVSNQDDIKLWDLYWNKIIIQSASNLFTGGHDLKYLDMAKIAIGLTGKLMFLGLTDLGGIGPIAAAHFTKIVLVPVSKLLADIFWPKKYSASESDTTWYLINTRVEALIQQDIIQYDNSSLAQLINGFQAVVEDLHDAVNVAICLGSSPDNQQTSTSCIPYSDPLLNENVRTKFSTAESTFRALLPQFQKSGYEFAELPQFCHAATLHLSLLQSGITQADHWGIDSSLRNSYASQMRDLIKTYTQYVYSTFDKQSKKIQPDSLNGKKKSEINKYLSFLSTSITECLDYVATWRFYDVYDYPFPSSADFTRLAPGIIVGPSENTHLDPADSDKKWNEDPAVLFTDLDLAAGTHKGSSSNWDDFLTKTYSPIIFNGLQLHVSAPNLNEIVVDGMQLGYDYTNLDGTTTKQNIKHTSSESVTVKDSHSPDYPNDHWETVPDDIFPLTAINVLSQYTQYLDTSSFIGSSPEFARGYSPNKVSYKKCTYKYIKDDHTTGYYVEPCQSSAQIIGTDTMHMLYPVTAKASDLEHHAISGPKFGGAPLYTHTDLIPGNVIGQLDDTSTTDGAAASPLLQIRTIPAEKGYLHGNATHVVERVTGANSVSLKNTGEIQLPLTVLSTNDFFIRVHAATTDDKGTLTLKLDDNATTYPIQLENTQQYYLDESCTTQNSCYSSDNNDCTTCNDKNPCYNAETKTCTPPSHPMWVAGVNNRIYALFPKMGIDVNNPGIPAIPRNTVVNLSEGTHTLTITNNSNSEIIIDRIEFVLVPPPLPTPPFKKTTSIPTTPYIAISNSETLIWQMSPGDPLATRADITPSNYVPGFWNTHEIRFYYGDDLQPSSKTTANGIDTYTVPTGFNQMKLQSTDSNSETVYLAVDIYSPTTPIEPPISSDEKQIFTMATTPFAVSSAPTTVLSGLLQLANRVDFQEENVPKDFLTKYQFQFYYNDGTNDYLQSSSQTSTTVAGKKVDMYTVPTGFNKVTLVALDTKSPNETAYFSAKVYAPNTPLTPPPPPPQTNEHILQVIPNTSFTSIYGQSTQIWSSTVIASRAEITFEQLPENFWDTHSLQFYYNDFPQPVQLYPASPRPRAGTTTVYIATKGFNKILILSKNQETQSFILSGKIYAPTPVLSPPPTPDEIVIATIPFNTSLVTVPGRYTDVWYSDEQLGTRAEVTFDYQPPSTDISFKLGGVDQEYTRVGANGNTYSYTVPNGFNELTVYSGANQYRTVVMSGKIFQSSDFKNRKPPASTRVDQVSNQQFTNVTFSKPDDTGLTIWKGQDVVGNALTLRINTSEGVTIPGDETRSVYSDEYLTGSEVQVLFHDTEVYRAHVDSFDSETPFYTGSFDTVKFFGAFSDDILIPWEIEPPPPGIGYGVGNINVYLGIYNEPKPSTSSDQAIFTKLEDLDKIKHVVNQLFKDPTHTTLSSNITSYWLDQVKQKIDGLSEQKFALEKQMLQELITRAQALSANRNLLLDGDFESSSNWVLGRAVKIYSGHNLFAGNYAFLPSPERYPSYVFQKIDESKLKENTRYTIRGFVANSAHLEVVAARYGVELKQILNVPYGTALPLSADNQSNCCEHINNPCTPCIPDNDQKHLFTFSIDVGKLHRAMDLGIEFGLRIVDTSGYAKISNLEVVEDRPLTVQEICTVQEKEKTWMENFTKKVTKVVKDLQPIVLQLNVLFNNKDWDSQIPTTVTYQKLAILTKLAKDILSEIPDVHHWLMPDREGPFYQIVSKIEKTLAHVLTQLEERNLLHNGSFYQDFTNWSVTGEPSMTPIEGHLSAVRLKSPLDSISQTITINELNVNQQYKLRIIAKGTGIIRIQNGNQVSNISFSSSDFNSKIQNLQFNTPTVQIKISPDNGEFLLASIELLEGPTPDCK